MVLEVGHGTSSLCSMPEASPSSWHAALRGRKRWLFHPPGEEAPPHLLGEGGRARGAFDETLECLVEEGEVVWVPSGWWREGCTLDEQLVALSGTSFDGCCDWASAHEDAVGPGPQTACYPDYNTAHQHYTLADLPGCDEERCPSLSAF